MYVFTHICAGVSYIEKKYFSTLTEKRMCKAFKNIDKERVNFNDATKVPKFCPHL